MFCVMPDELQDQAINQIARVLKPDGKFLILEMIYSPERYFDFNGLLTPFFLSLFNFGERNHKKYLIFFGEHAIIKVSCATMWYRRKLTPLEKTRHHYDK
jgi:ubiquinone/menaquinone biosynthesis C-methylase UbiE